MLRADVMTKTVRTIDSTDSIRQAAMLMRDLDVGMLPVRQGNQLVGTLTDRDMTVRATAEGGDPDNTSVADVMTREIVFAYDDDETGNAAKTMQKNRCDVCWYWITRATAWASSHWPILHCAARRRASVKRYSKRSPNRAPEHDGPGSVSSRYGT